MNGNQLDILGICGSLREESWNKKLLEAAQEFAPDGMTISVYTLEKLPMYDPDVEARGYPAPVRDFHQRIRDADGVLFSTPEYNYSLPGVLKNALDWASRPYGNSPLRFKPAAVMGATIGPFGTVRAQMVLRQVLLYTRSLVMVEPEVSVYNVEKRFDRQGNLTDEETRMFLRDLITGLDDWVRSCIEEAARSAASETA